MDNKIRSYKILPDNNLKKILLISQLLLPENFTDFYLQRSCQVYVCKITLMLVVREWVHTDLSRRSVNNLGAAV